MIDWNIFITAVAVGSVAEMLTLHYPSRYRQAVSVVKVIAIAAGLALLPLSRLPSWLAPLVAGLLIVRIGDVLAEYCHAAVVRVAVLWDRKKWDTSQSQTDEQPEESTSITSEI